MKNLEVTKTKIGEKIGSYKGRYTIFSVYYGNYISPMIENEFVHLKEAEYEELLESFLNSEEGKEYKRPSEKEIREASAAVLNSEIFFLKEKEGDKVELNLEEKKEKPAQPEVFRPQEAAVKKKKILTVLLTVFILLQTGLSIFFVLT